MPRTLQEIIDSADELARRIDEYEPTDAERAYSEALATVHRATVARAEAERALAEAVHAARTAGAPWASIGAMLGTSGEAARQRYGGHADRPRKAG